MKEYKEYLTEEEYNVLEELSVTVAHSDEEIFRLYWMLRVLDEDIQETCEKILDCSFASHLFMIDPIYFAKAFLGDLRMLKRYGIKYTLSEIRVERQIDDIKKQFYDPILNCSNGRKEMQERRNALEETFKMAWKRIRNFFVKN